MTPVTEHFSQEEFACHDGTPYPLEWVGDRLVPLCEQLEIIRAHCGNRPVHIDSGYRTAAYNAKLPGAAKDSQHVQGRAADIVVDDWSAHDVHDLVLALWYADKLKIGGLGFYPAAHPPFVHVDIRQNPDGHLSQWTGPPDRVSNQV